MPAKNLIALKQLRTDEVSGYSLLVASGYLASVSGNIISYVDGRDASVSGYAFGLFTGVSGYVNTVSGQIKTYVDNAILTAGILSSGVQIPLSSGVDSLSVSWGLSFGATPKILAFPGSASVNDPILIAFLRSGAATGAIIDLSDQTRSSSYYLNFSLRS